VTGRKVALYEPGDGTFRFHNIMEFVNLTNNYSLLADQCIASLHVSCYVYSLQQSSVRNDVNNLALNILT
jgi:hypothetical protein